MHIIKNIVGIGLLSAIVVITCSLLVISNHSEEPTVSDHTTTSITATGDMLTDSSSSDPRVARDLASLAERVFYLEQKIDEWGVTRNHMDLPQASDDITGLKAEINGLVSIVEGLQSQAIGAEVHEKDVGFVDQFNEQEIADKTWEAFANDENAFALQEYDIQWADEVKEALHRELASNEYPGVPGVGYLPENLLDALECRVNTCRLEIVNNGDMSMIHEQFILRSAGLFASGNVHYTESGNAIFFLNAH